MYYLSSNIHNETVALVGDKVVVTSVDASFTGHFIGVIDVQDRIRKGLFYMLLEKLEKHNLNISDCHDQSYDNGSNMLGHKQGFGQEYCSVFPAAVTL